MTSIRMANKTHWAIGLFLVVLLLPSCKQEEQVDSIVKLEKQYPEIRKKYVYQSLIRLANVKHDPDFESLIKDVKKVVLYLPPHDDSTYQITHMRGEIRNEGFEELIDVRTSDAQRISLWVKESGEHSKYVALVDSEDDDVILEVDGEIHPEYLTSISMADESSLLDLLKGGF